MATWCMLQAPNGAAIELPAFVQPGQHDRVLAIALGYGVKGTDRFARIGPQWLELRPTVAPGELVGRNAAGFVEFRGGSMQFAHMRVALEKVAGRRALATTQEHHSLEVPRNVARHGAEVREIVQETTLAAFARNPGPLRSEAHHPTDEQLWSEDHPKTGHDWGMVIDLNCLHRLFGLCDRLPIGKQRTGRRQRRSATGREMHWIRIDRYYSGQDNGIDVFISR